MVEYVREPTIQFEIEPMQEETIAYGSQSWIRGYTRQCSAKRLKRRIVGRSAGDERRARTGRRPAEYAQPGRGRGLQPLDMRQTDAIHGRDVGLSA